MKVEVEVISKEFVKPSSPTLSHPRHYQFSFLDQITPRVYNSMVYFFAPNNDNESSSSCSERLKSSLAEALAHYYPLAGRFINHTFIDCNDEGAPYLEARVNCHLNDIIDNPIPSEMSKLLPFQVDDANLDLALGVQLNIFQCGGIAIGACISHKVGDAMSYFEFIKSWSALSAPGQADNAPVIIKTHFQSAQLFPPQHLSGFDPNAPIPKEEIVSKRFVFDAYSIESLKKKYNYERIIDGLKEGQKPPSRVEVLSAFIWSRFMATTQATESESHESESAAGRHNKLYIICHTVNLRPRMEPPLPKYAFGNYFRAAITHPSVASLSDDEAEVVMRQIGEEIKKIDREYVVKLQEGTDENTSSLRNSKGGELVPFNFTSLCRFPLYDADFGWGKPTWVGPPAWKFKNVAVFVDSKSPGAIDAYVSLTPGDMALFQRDQDLLAHVSTIN